MSSLKIVADQQILLAKEVFSQFGEVELCSGRDIDHETVKNADALLVRSVTKVNEALLNKSNISFVASATSGIDHIDTDYLEKSDITFSHALGSNARSVAEYVLSSLFIAAEQQSFSLSDKTIGIIGCGQVGSRVKKFMDAIGVNCLINDPPLAEQNNEYDFVDLEDIVEADIITLHVPLIMDGKYPTHKLVNNDFLNKLKNDVIFINTSRGEVIDEAALLAFKHANNAATLILDVWCNEPNIDINLLEETFIATPHIAGYSYDGKLKATEMLFNAVNSHFETGFKSQGLLNSDPTIMNIAEDAIQLVVLQSYDVRTDAIALRNLMSIDKNERAEYFDSLRKNYPIRREFTNRVIKTSAQTNGISDKIIYKLQQLGFNIESL